MRLGKYVEVKLDETDKTKAEAQLKEMCEKLLANTVIEDYPDANSIPHPLPLSQWRARG